MLKHFIRAERTGNWNLHVVTVGQMLNLFAATGHLIMQKVPDFMYKICKNFMLNIPGSTEISL